MNLYPETSLAIAAWPCVVILGPIGLTHDVCSRHRFNPDFQGTDALRQMWAHTPRAQLARGDRGP